MTPETEARLIAEAASVRRMAHAPYSEFLVGAAVLTGSGRIFAACNVENASYGLTICAERFAVGQAVAAGERDLQAVAVVTEGGHAPCGACRQVLAEFADDIPVLLVDSVDERITRETLAGLLPRNFRLE